MERKRIKRLLKDLQAKRIDLTEALNQLRSLPFEDLGFAKIDTHRDLRRGFPEVILCQGKTQEQLKRIIHKQLSTSEFVMATKVDQQAYKTIQAIRKDAVYYEQAKIVVIGRRKKSKGKKKILVISAGTADLPVAEEAAVTAEAIGQRVERLYDVGVAGIHRLLTHKHKLFKANVIVVVAGMEGALASVVAGLVARPVIAVPTSVGYGASFKGLSALLTMLNCCVPGVTVVNIDNGFGAGYCAALINR